MASLICVKTNSCEQPSGMQQLRSQDGLAIVKKLDSPLASYKIRNVKIQHIQSCSVVKNQRL